MKPIPKITIPKTAFSLGGHRSLTILIVSLLLFIALCVFFVNTFVLTPGNDEQYKVEAEKKAQLIKFNTSLLQQAQEFSSNSNNTALPAGRINPFAP